VEPFQVPVLMHTFPRTFSFTLSPPPQRGPAPPFNGSKGNDGPLANVALLAHTEVRPPRRAPARAAPRGPAPRPSRASLPSRGAAAPCRERAWGAPAAVGRRLPLAPPPPFLPY
jgi:hypothetical protein